MKMGEREVKCFCPKCLQFFEDDDVLYYNGISEIEEFEGIYCPSCHNELVDIDEGMVEIVQILNDSKMVKTIFCCEGHMTEDENGYVDDLSDPYVCFVLTDCATFNDIFDIGYLPTDDICHKEVIKNKFEAHIGDEVVRTFIRFSMRNCVDYSEKYKVNKRLFDIDKKQFLKDLKNYALTLKMKGVIATRVEIEK